MSRKFRLTSDIKERQMPVAEDLLPQFSLNVLDTSGHMQSIWDPAVPDEVAAAREQFNKFKKKGYVAYNVKRGGEAGSVMDEFDETAGAIIMRPAVVGG